MLRISSFPLSVSFTLTLLFLTPPPPLCSSHPLPICLSLVLPLSFLHFTILFLSPSRCFKAHITPFSLSISLFFSNLFLPNSQRLRVCIYICKLSLLHLKIYICSLVIVSYQQLKKVVVVRTQIYSSNAPQNLSIYRLWHSQFLSVIKNCHQDLWGDD